MADLAPSLRKAGEAALRLRDTLLAIDLEAAGAMAAIGVCDAELASSGGSGPGYVSALARKKRAEGFLRSLTEAKSALLRRTARAMWAFCPKESGSFVEVCLRGLTPEEAGKELKKPPSQVAEEARRACMALWGEECPPERKHR